MKKKVDWKRIEKEYVHSSISYKDLSEKYGVPYSTLRKVGKRQNWVDKRAQFGRKVDAENKKLDEQAAIDKAQVYHKVMDKSLYAEQKLLEQTLQIAMAIDMFDENAVSDLKSAQKTIESIVQTTEKICFPEHEHNEQHITITMDKETKDYAI